MPCVNGEPREFQFQDAQARWQKQVLPKSKVLQYRITDAVPYAQVNELSVLFARFFCYCINTYGSIFIAFILHIYIIYIKVVHQKMVTDPDYFVRW